STIETWWGMIKEVRIWKIVRTDQQIQDDYKAPLTNPTGRPNLVGYWKLDEGSGTTAGDSSQYGNHGTINGARWVVDDGFTEDLEGNTGVKEIIVPYGISTATLYIGSDRLHDPAVDFIAAGIQVGDHIYTAESIDINTGEIRFPHANYTIRQVDQHDLYLQAGQKFQSRNPKNPPTEQRGYMVFRS